MTAEFRAYISSGVVYFSRDDVVAWLRELQRADMDPINAVIARPLLGAIADTLADTAEETS